MRKLLKTTGSSNMYLYMLAFLAAGAAWRGGEFVQTRMSALPVKDAPRVNAANTQIDQKNFYPIWVKQQVAMAQAQGDAEVDALFMKQEEPKPTEVKPVEPDYVAMFKETASIDGVADNGVYVNGRFYKVKEPMTELAIGGVGGASVVPVLDALQNGKAIFRVGTKKLVFVYRQDH